MAKKKGIKIKNPRDKEAPNPSAFRKIWKFLWDSDSFLSWIVDLALIYLIVKFIFFPAMSFIFASSLPSVIVESQSMVHQGNFEQWWQDYGGWYTSNNITKQEVSGWKFHNGINKGDIIIVVGSRTKQYSLNVGEVIIFDAHQRVPIIHRVIYNNTIISTKGDNNQGQLPVEKEILQQQIIGKAVFRIPRVGWIKLVFVDFFKGILGR